MDILTVFRAKKQNRVIMKKKMGHQGGSKRRGEYRIVTLFFVLA